MSIDPREVEEFRCAREDVLARIAAACARAGRSPADVTLVAVSKTVAAERLAAAVAAGLSVLGENRVQEAAAKRPEIEALLAGSGFPPGLAAPPRWHLVGPLQSNKARRAVETFDLVQSVDSVELAGRLDRIVREVRGLPPAGAGPVADGARLPILLQVNVDDDPSKAGFAPGDVVGAIRELAGFDALRLDGLMTIGRLVASELEARATFRALRELSESLRSVGAGIGSALSMGMSDDFEAAVEEGATIVRVGRALFGARPAP